MKLSIQDFDQKAVMLDAFSIEDDPYYNLFFGGYIKPEKMLLDPEKAKEVRAAMKIVQSFMDCADLIVQAHNEENED